MRVCRHIDNTIEVGRGEELGAYHIELGCSQVQVPPAIVAPCFYQSQALPSVTPSARSIPRPLRRLSIMLP